MSYGLFLSFVKQPMLTEGDAYKYASDLVKRIANTPELANERIDDCMRGIAARLENIKFNREDKDVWFNTVGIQSALDAAMHDIFSMRFVYWPQHQLLAAVDEFPTSLIDQVTEIYFQNSTDQDYPFDEWSDTISLFKQEKESVLALSAEEVTKELPWIGETDEDSDDYDRKTVMYRRIFNKLALDNYLYRQDEEDGFVTFRVSGVGNAHLQSNLRTAIRVAVKNKMEQDPWFLVI